MTLLYIQFALISLRPHQFGEKTTHFAPKKECPFFFQVVGFLKKPSQIIFRLWGFCCQRLDLLDVKIRESERAFLGARLGCLQLVLS